MNRSQKNGTILVLAVLMAGVSLIPNSVHAEMVIVSDAPAANLLQAPALPAVAAAQGYWDARQETPCLTANQRRDIQRALQTNISDLRARGILPAAPDKAAGVLMIWPVQKAAHVTDPGVHGISNFVDQAAAYPDQLLDYNCGPRTYDLSSGYNHQGTDIFTWPFSWHKMDNDDVEVVAGAAGVIIGRYDGNYDRNCDFGSGNWNAVYIQHADGSVAWYGHMKNGSLTGKSVGASVAAGEYLGIVGSSGNSTGPHLHLEVYDQLNNLVDPWDGACNTLNNDSWWESQPPYYDSAINALRTHRVPPVWQACPTPATINDQDAFVPGDLVYFASYYRDQLQGQLSTHQILRPDDSIWQQWTSALDVAHYAASWWYWSWYLPTNAETGVWTYRVTYQGDITDHRFTVGTVSSVPEVARTGATLRQPEPNPFNPTTTIGFSLDRDGEVVLSVHDLQGRRVATLHKGRLGAGEHSVRWDGRGSGGGPAASGVYLVQLRYGGQTLAQRVVLLK
jgi:murein DD-endopeptidase MepM/ murein hydrolase activator NlpD